MNARIHEIVFAIKTQWKRVAGFFGLILVILLSFSLIGVWLLSDTPTVGEQAALATLNAVVISLLVSIIFKFPERIGIKAQTFVHMSELFKKQSDVVSNEIQNIHEKVENLISSRFNRGLVGVFDKIDEESILRGLGEGDKLRWLNTRISALEEWSDLLIDAAVRGADIKIMLVDEGSTEVEFRWKEAYGNLMSLEEYESRIKNQKSFAKNLMKETQSRIREIAENDIELDSFSGRLKFLFYDSNASFPIFLLRKKNEHKVAYTGYFMHTASGNMPYLCWETAIENPFLNDIEEFFDRRWETIINGDNTN